MMRFRVILVFFAVLSFFLIQSKSEIFAQEQKQVVIVNPIRGNDFWSQNFDLLETSKNEYSVIKKNNLKATWLIRYDALKDQSIDNFLLSLDPSQEIGLFLEITPSLTKDANVVYNQSQNWHYPKSLFLVGYTPNDRKKLIDTAVRKYQEVFSKTPTAVGAWWIDAFSLNYLKDKYKIEANLDVSDQYSTDQYQIWGQYWSLPFYPSRNNALVPAPSRDLKNGIVTIQWAARDPYNSYGNGVHDSTYSVQANDYLIHNLDVNYFEKLLNIYPQVVVGLENDFSWSKFGTEYSNQIDLLAKKQREGIIQTKTMSEYASYYIKAYPDLSPPYLIVADNPLGDGKVAWYQNLKYRVGWFYDPQKGSIIRDLRGYDDGLFEECFNKACQTLNLAAGSLSAIDDVTFGNGWIIDQGKVSNIKIQLKDNIVEINYANQAGTTRIIKFLPNDIDINGKIKTISQAIMDANNKSETSIYKQPLNLPLSLDLTYTLTQQLLSLIKFLIFSLLFFFLPGLALSRRYLFAIPVGLCLFTLVTFTLSWISKIFLHNSFQLDFLIWLLPIFGGVIVYKKSLLKVKFLKPPLMLTSVIILGSASWLATSVKNGLVFGYGLGFWGSQGHDGIWHLALISELQHNFPPNNPVFAGEKLTNYHYFFDLLLAKVGSFASIDNQDLLFRLFPFIVSLFCGILIFEVSKRIYSNYLSGVLAVFFLYFGGSFGFIVSYIKDHTLGGESTFWSQQAVSTLLNMPFALSIVIFLSGLLLFLELEKSQNKFKSQNIIPLVLLWGTLIEFKAYAGVLVLGSLTLLSLENLIIKREAKLLVVTVFCTVVSLVVFLPNNVASTSLFVFSPLWLVSTMVQFQDRLGWDRLYLTMQSGVLVKVILGFIFATLLFIVGNLGTRSIAVFKLGVIFKQRFLFYFLILALIIPLLFIQKGTNWNSIQFFYYEILILNIFAAVSFFSLIANRRKSIQVVIIIIMLVATLPTTWNSLGQYLPSRPPTRLSSAEFEALDFLKLQPKGTVLTLSFDPKFKNNFSEPVPLVAYVSTGYVSAFSAHPVFLEDTINLDILGVDYKGRLNIINDFTKITDQSKVLLKKNNISYVYIVNGQDIQIDTGKMGLDTIFENKEVRILKTKE